MGLLDDDSKVLKSRKEDKKKRKLKKDSLLGQYGSLKRFQKSLEKTKASEPIVEKKQEDKSKDLEKINLTNIDDMLFKKKSSKTITETKVTTPVIEIQNKDTNNTRKSNIEDTVEDTNRIQNEIQKNLARDTKEIQKLDKTDTVKDTNKTQLYLNTELVPNVRMVTGQNKKFLDICFLDCKSNGSKTTNPMKRNDLATLIGIKPQVVGTLANRLKKAGYIISGPSKPGRGGFVEYTIPIEVYNQLVDLEMRNNYFKGNLNNSLNQDTIRDTQKDTNPSSSSSIKYNTTVTKSKIDFEIEKLEIPKPMLEAGYTKTHLKQLFQPQVFSVEEIQESLDNYSYDLEHRHAKPSKSVVQHLHGVMRGDNAALWASPHLNQKIQEEKLQQIKNAKQIKKDLEAQAKGELEVLSLNIYDSLSNGEKLKILPETNLLKLESAIHRRSVLSKIMQDITDTGDFSIDNY